DLMPITQPEKAARFRQLHEGPGAFVIPNPWDVASARILAGLGFPALATSSAASATSIGRRDGGLTRDQALAHARVIVNATDLPVSADLEKGFGGAPEVVAETVRLAAEAGLVGCTIEDSTGKRRQAPLRPFIGCRTDCSSRGSGRFTRISISGDGASAQFCVSESK